jgi:hypothetical protein
MSEDLFLTPEDEGLLDSLSEMGKETIIIPLKNTLYSIDKLNSMSIDMDSLIKREEPRMDDVIIHDKRTKDNEFTLW